jgi:UDP-glucose 4-epimerase
MTDKAMETPYKTALITGACGYVGNLLVKAMAKDKAGLERVIATDIRTPAPEDNPEGIDFQIADVRDPKLADLMMENEVDLVVHLAAMVTPGKKSNRELEYSVDVLGSKNVLECCVKANVKKIIVTSSGAAYGYYADNPEWIVETDAIRGNPEFAYSDHKRRVEEILADYRETHPELGQLILRPGAILGKTTRNQITDLFDAKFVIGLWGSSIPFALIWDQDVVGAILKGIREPSVGIYNMAGDGRLTMREMARIMGKTYIPVPVSIVKGGLWLMKKLAITQYGPEQVRFLRYRPVLSNEKLKKEFGYIPEKTTRQVFDYFLENRKEQ